MSRKQSINVPYRFTNKTYRYLASEMGIPADKMNTFNPEFMKKYNTYQNDAKLLFYKSAELQDSASRVLSSSDDDDKRQTILQDMADFCVVIHGLSDEELNTFLVDAQKNAFCDMLNLERCLRESKTKEYSEINHFLKDRLKPYKNFSFNSHIPGGTKVEYRQIGTSFIYSMLGTLNGIDMGKDSACYVYEAKVRAGIKPTETEERIYESEKKREKWVEKTISFEQENIKQENTEQENLHRSSGKKASTLESL